VCIFPQAHHALDDKTDKCCMATAVMGTASTGYKKEEEQVTGQKKKGKKIGQA
jgi:hypothetical protein